MARTTRVTADTLVLRGPGRLIAISGQKTAAALTAGVITAYDNTAEGGTVLWQHRIDLASDIPFNVAVLARCTTGIYIGYDATLAGVAFTITFDTEN